jgi:hypothetical protein
MADIVLSSVGFAKVDGGGSTTLPTGITREGLPPVGAIVDRSSWLSQPLVFRAAESHQFGTR